MKWKVTANHLTFENLSVLGVPHCVTTRSWGSLNPFVGYQGMRRLASGLELLPQPSLPNRALGESIIFAEQIHGNAVHRCLESDGGSIRLAVDGLATDSRSSILAIYSADCFPILLYDPAHRVACVLHAGRRGLIGGIVASGIGLMATDFGTSPSDLIVGVGPGMRSCCYEIQPDIFPELEAADWNSYLQERDGKYYLAIERACMAILKVSGVLPANIEDMNLCTACRTDLLFSARRRTSDEERGSSIAALMGVP